MRKHATVLCVALIAALALASAPSVEAKARIAVVNFDNKAAWGGWRAGYAAAEMMTEELFKTGKFDLYERSQLDAILQEQGLGKSGAVSAATAAKIGKLAGVQYIVIGTVTKFGKRQQGGGGWRFSAKKATWEGEVNVRMVSVNTGQILLMDSASSAASRVNVRVMGYGGGTDYDDKLGQDVLGGAIHELAQKVVAQAGLVPDIKPTRKRWNGGKVSKVSGDKIYLNGGSRDGVRVGDEFAVYQIGEEIIDPDTGESLGSEDTKIGSVTVVDAKEKYSIAAVKDGSGFAKGNKVKP